MCLTRKAGKNLTWGSVPTHCPSQDELCVLHTGDFHKRGVHSSEAAMTCWASLYQRLFSKALRNKWVLVAALVVWISNTAVGRAWWEKSLEKLLKRNSMQTNLLCNFSSLHLVEREIHALKVR